MQFKVTMFAFRYYMVVCIFLETSFIWENYHGFLKFANFKDFFMATSSWKMTGRDILSSFSGFSFNHLHCITGMWVSVLYSLRIVTRIPRWRNTSNVSRLFLKSNEMCWNVELCILRFIMNGVGVKLNGGGLQGFWKINKRGGQNKRGVITNIKEKRRN